MAPLQLTILIDGCWRVSPHFDEEEVHKLSKYLLEMLFKSSHYLGSELFEFLLNDRDIRVY